MAQLIPPTSVAGLIAGLLGVAAFVSPARARHSERGWAARQASLTGDRQAVAGG